MKQPCVIGYKGEIGSFILNGLLKVMPKALDIWCVDVNETEDEVAERIQKSDVIFLCVPMEDTGTWILKHENLLNDKIIVEQCSLKEKLSGLKGFDIRSMHILFRPSQTPNLEDRTVGLIKGQFDDGMVNMISAITQSKIVFYKDTAEHDAEMAIQQALLHRMLLVMGGILRGCNGSTYISKKVLELEERIRKGNKGLYKQIQKNRHLPEQIDRMLKEFDNFQIDDYWR